MLRDIIKKMQKNQIKIEYFAPDKGIFGRKKLPLCSSKIGGLPHVPASFEWPYFEYEDEEETISEPLAFLAQFNLEEVKEYDTENILPQKGMLYFFYALQSMKWGFDPEDKGCARVFYHDDLKSIALYKHHKQIQNLNFIPEQKLAFQCERSNPPIEEIEKCHDISVDSAEYYDITQTGDAPITKLLGHPDIIQDAMEFECEAVTSGYYAGDGYRDSREDFDKITRNCEESNWKLLFQMGNIVDGDFELDFVDCGQLYFWIKDKDLKNLNFDNTWTILQCF